MEGEQWETQNLWWLVVKERGTGTRLDWEIERLMHRL